MLGGRKKNGARCGEVQRGQIRFVGLAITSRIGIFTER